MSMQGPVPTGVVVHQESRVLELDYEDGQRFRLSFEFLRVHSPSAEVRGHSKDQERLQVGKREVRITAITPIGHYAIQLHFDDGHESGIYSWDYLHEIAVDHDRLWADYLERLQRAGKSRDPQPGDAGAARKAARSGAHHGAAGARAVTRPRR